MNITNLITNDVKTKIVGAAVGGLVGWGIGTVADSAINLIETTIFGPTKQSIKRECQVIGAIAGSAIAYQLVEVHLALSSMSKSINKLFSLDNISVVAGAAMYFGIRGR